MPKNKMENWESFEAMEETIRRDTKEVALALHQSESLVHKWTQRPATPEDFQQSGARNPIDRLLITMRTIDRKDPDRADIPVKYLCAARGFMPPVKMPKVQAANGDVMQGILKWMREIGETSKEIEKAMDDGHISKQDLKEIAREMREDVEAGQQLLALLEVLK